MSKRELLAWHRRIGIACALFLMLQGLTGAALAWRGPLERVLAPELRLTPSSKRNLPVERQITLARAAQPNAVLLRATYADDDLSPPRFLFDANGRFFMLALDPRSGIVLREGGLARWPIECAVRLHANLMSGSVGHILVGLDGAALVLLVVLGWQLWWPGKKRLRNGLKIVRGAGAERFLRSVHRTAGGIGAVLLLCAGLSGATLSWLPHVQPHFGSENVFTPRGTLDMALKSWSLRHNHATPARFTFEPGEQEPAQIHWNSSVSALPLRTTLRRGPHGLRISETSSTPGMAEFQLVVLGLHSGRVIEPLGRLIALTTAFLLMGLSGTGTWIWWRFDRQRRKHPSEHHRRNLPSNTGS
ncbi:PepSY-associated TM helix domain-containing protein [Sphingobium sp. YR768]|uniref:PepSY-associated TM helix domain-containing protein n=1 Tax=Sphingobium sp. YR768 TaxID=1884365 RepID=UPI0008B49A4F|nr:PepSY-associated TM helix domain-containing protein [Sphingobium sp. YR768]SER26383.1 Uncharacterized iron-regulated membrane protein [Sphingobium sp. YR768]